MQFIETLFAGVAGAWSGGIAHSILLLAMVIALGKQLGKSKIAGVSLGVTWVLFTGILFSHFGYTIDHNLLHFLKEFGLILFVYSIGLQVGPGFFSSLRSGGLKLNMLALFICLGGVGCALAIHVLTQIPTTTVTGIMSGAVTNTPGLGAAQAAYADRFSTEAPQIAQGYAVAYPLGVIGAILSFLLLKTVFYRNLTPDKGQDKSKKEHIDYSTKQSSQQTALSANSEPADTRFISRRIIISKKSLNGKSLENLHFEQMLGVSVTRIRRAGVELKANEHFRLQYGDLVSVVGSKESITQAEKVLGNSLKRLDEPNLVPIFMGIALGVILGSIPVAFPAMPQPVKLGLAGGPLIASILLSHFGPRMNVITYTTASANLMLREVGISLFLACVGLQAGEGFWETITHAGGAMWIAYGAAITVIPLLIAGVIGRFVLKLDYLSLIGVMAGATTNPPALAFAGEQDKRSEAAAVSYATVYPLTMFLRVLLAQLMILLA